MILYYIINALLPLVSWIVSFLPNADTAITDFISSATTNFRLVISQGNAWLDMTSLVLALGFIVTIEGSLVVYKFVRWFITFISAGFLKAN